jgi:hypothetical protein
MRALTAMVISGICATQRAYQRIVVQQTGSLPLFGFTDNTLSFLHVFFVQLVSNYLS